MRNGRNGAEDEPQVKKFHIDGSGARPDGSGSGWAWIRPATGKQRIKRIDHLTNNAAEYEALVAVLEYVVPNSRLEIATDSALVCHQFNGRWAVNEPRLSSLLDEARELIEEKNLEVEVRWIPREKNLAGELLDRERRMSA
jgi:ribonuclease HI